MRFGILSTASIARDSMIPAIQKSDHEVAAIASRDAERVTQVAEDFGIQVSCGSYEDLFAVDVDAIYNPLPNALHAKWTERAADAGLDILCEKPLTTDAAVAVDLFEYCSDASVTLMEGFMYRFHPQTERAHDIVTGELEQIRSVDATFKFRLSEPSDIRYNPDLGGGALLDAGCYTVSAVRGFLGEPTRAYAHFTDTRDNGVDTEVTGILEYDDGQTARVSTGFDTSNVQRYRVECVNGYLEVEDCFAPGTNETAITYAVDGREVTEVFSGVDQFRLEVEHFAECIAQDRTPRIDSEESISNMRTLDALAESATKGRPIHIT